MKKFTHGIIAVDPLDVDKDDMVAIVHFIGLWSAPTKEAFESLAEEIRTDPEFGLAEIADRLVILPAPSEIIDIYNGKLEEYRNNFNPHKN